MVVPEIVPIAELPQRQDEILSKLAEQPIILTLHDRAAAVLVSPETWNQMVEDLEDLYDTQDAAAAYEEYKRDPSTARPWEEIEAELIAEGLLDE
jgi:PHD/YefM family antitoxin component YafN of YafNO toxin-antitoxin module